MAEYRQRGSLPCADCGTRGGHVCEGDLKPRRRRALCDVCYRWHLSCRSLDKFPIAEGYASRSGKRTRIPSQRRVEQWEAIAERVARHEAINGVAMLPVVESEVDAAIVVSNAEYAAEAWLTAHPQQTARWDRPDLQAYIPGGARNAA